MIAKIYDNLDLYKNISIQFLSHHTTTIMAPEEKHPTTCRQVAKKKQKKNMQTSKC